MAIRRAWLRIGLLSLLATAAVLGAGAGWLLGSASGLRWLAGVAQERSGGTLEIGGTSGALFGDFGAQRLLLRGANWRVEISQLHVQWQPVHLLQGELRVLDLSARAVDVLKLPGTEPFALPSTLRLPLAIDVRQLQIGDLRLFEREQGAPVFAAAALRARYRAGADAHQLQDVLARVGNGEVAADLRVAPESPFAVQGKLAWHGELPLAGDVHGVDALAELRGDLRRLELNFSAAGAGAQLNAAVHLLPTAPMPLAQVQASFSGLDLRNWQRGAPATALSGTLELKGTAAEMLDGTLHLANARPAPLDQGGLPLTSARTRLAYTHGTAHLHGIELRLRQDGLLQGEADWQLHPLHGSARLQVRALDPSALDSRAPTLALQGTLALDVGAARQQAQLDLHDEQWGVSALLEKRGAQIDVSRLRLARGQAVLAGSGQMQLDAQRHFHLDARLQHLDLSEFAALPQTRLNAGLSSDGTLLPEPSGLLDFVFFDSRFGRYPFDGDGRLRLLAGPRAMGDMNVRLGDNTLDFSLAYGTPDDHLRLTLEAPQLAELGGGLSGRLAGQMEMRGSLAAPVAGFSLRGEELVLPSGISIGELVAGGALDGGQVKLHLESTALRDGGALAMPQLRLDLDGSAEQHTLQIETSLARFEQALEEVALTASGGWQRTEQSWRWRGALEQMRGRGVLPLQLRAAAPLTVTPQDVVLGNAPFDLAGGHLDLRETRWSPRGWHTRGDFSGIGVRAIDADKAAQAGRSEGELPAAWEQALDTLRFGGEWEVSAAPDWRGSMLLRRESGDWRVDANTGQGMGLNDLRLAVRAEHDLLDLHLTASGTRLGEINAQASLPYFTRNGAPAVAPDAALHGRVQLDSADLGWLGPLLDGNLQTGGTLHLAADLLGTRAMPRLLGEAHGADLRVALLDQGVQLEQGTLALRFAPDAIRVDRLDFVAPYLAPPRDPLLSEYRIARSAGHLSAHGNMALGSDVAELEVVAEGLPLAQRADRWLIVTGKAHAQYASKTLRLNGDIRADAGLIRQLASNKPRWSDDVRLVGQAEDRQSDFGRIAAFNLDLGEHFYLRALGLESRLSGTLAVSGVANEVMQGSGSIATEEGKLEVYGQRLDVERGIVNFQGPLDDPGLNILALRKGLSVEAGVEVSGTARHPVTRLVSTPEVPDAEKLSWIVLGRVPESGGLDTSLLLAAAGNAIGGSTTGQIGRAIGVDELSLRQTEGGDVLQSQVVTVGKRLSSRAYLSYEQGVADTGGIAKFTYTLTPRITIVTRSGLEDAVDLFYSFRFY